MGTCDGTVCMQRARHATHHGGSPCASAHLPSHASRVRADNKQERAWLHKYTRPSGGTAAATLLLTRRRRRGHDAAAYATHIDRPPHNRDARRWTCSVSRSRHLVDTRGVRRRPEDASRHTRRAIRVAPARSRGAHSPWQLFLYHWGTSFALIEGGCSNNSCGLKSNKGGGLTLLGRRRF